HGVGGHTHHHAHPQGRVVLPGPVPLRRGGGQQVLVGQWVGPGGGNGPRHLGGAAEAVVHACTPVKDLVGLHTVRGLRRRSRLAAAGKKENTKGGGSRKNRTGAIRW